MKVKVISIFERETDKNGIYVNTTSKSENDWQRDLSPFYLGPCELYNSYIAKNVENGWQYSKVYKQYIDSDNEPTEEYFQWAKLGWDNPKAVRYPMGKGAKPEYAWWNGKPYDYIEARKMIYAPLYTKSVIKTAGYKKLRQMLYNSLKQDNKTLYLKDYDAYRHEDMNMTLTGVLNYPNKKMGHAFVLMMLLTHDDALNQCNLISADYENL